MAAALAAASVFFWDNHSSFGTCPGASGQYRCPRNWVCPSDCIGLPHTRQLYCFLFTSVLTSVEAERAGAAGPVELERAVAAAAAFLRRHSVVRDTALGGSEVGTEVGTALSPPVLFTFACPSVSTGSTSGCGCCGGGGGEEGRSLGGCSGSEAQTLGDGRERPCMRVLISLLLVVFLYHLTYETKMEALPEMLRHKVVIQWVIKSKYSPVWPH